MRETPHLYRYVGPKRIAERASDVPGGRPIRAPADVWAWIDATQQRPDRAGLLIATFVIDTHGVLLIADRRSEHVACAGRQTVLSAGEMTFQVSARTVEVVEVSNQSTRYCPEPETWPAVVVALASAGFAVPIGFSPCCEFRCCLACGQNNLVKGAIFECLVCGSALSPTYNCQTASG